MDVQGWERDGEVLRRTFTFAGFAEAMAFVVRVGFAAEAADHHPDIQISYRKVTLAFTTHSAGRLTQKDVEGARAAADVAAVMGAR